LCSVRHAFAHKLDRNRWSDDSKRPPTAEGEKKFRRVAGRILLVPDVGVVLNSLFVQTWRTRSWGRSAGLPPSLARNSNLTVRRLCTGRIGHYNSLDAITIFGHREGLRSHRGTLSLVPGSSGWTDVAGEEKVWMELFLRGSSWEEFGRPRLHPR
jgi:hypothetical protein